MSSFESFQMLIGVKDYPGLQKVFDESKDLGEALEAINSAYRLGVPVVPDDVYDHVLLPALRRMDPEHPFFSKIEPEPLLPGATLVRHAQPMLSTDKAYDQKAVDGYLRRVAVEAERLGISVDSLSYRVTPKLDGIAVNDDGQRLVTRGDGEQGQDISRVLHDGVLVEGSRGLGKAELVCDLNFFEGKLGLGTEFNMDSARNFVAGYVAADTLKPHHQVALDGRALRLVPFATLAGAVVSHEQLRKEWLALYDSIVRGVPYGTDGIVVEVENHQLREAMGATSSYERWKLAIKQQTETAETPVLEIQLTTGRTGRVIPTLLVKAVRLSDATVSRVTAHTATNLANLGIGPGAWVQITRAGEVIPKLLSVTKRSDTPLIVTHCPSCNSELVQTGEHLVCPNVGGCQAQTEAKLRHWFHTLGNVDLFGPKTIESLVENNVLDVPTIYGLSAMDFQAMGFGPGQSANLVTQLRRSREHPVADWRFLAAFGIRHLGRGDAARLLKTFPLEDLSQITAFEIEQIKDFGPKTSPKIALSLQERWPEIQHMLTLGFNLERTPVSGELTPASAEGLLAGEKVVFTGTMKQGKRSDMESHASMLGADVQSGVNGQTTMLVIGEKAGSKLSKAEKINQKSESPTIRILSEQEYLSLIAP